MPSVIDPQTLYVDDLPAIWSPVQWELTDEERIKAVEEPATAVLIVRLVAGMFRAQALLSGQAFNLKTYLRALVGKM